MQKRKSLEYEVTKNETLVTNISYKILILSLLSDVITYNIMKRVSMVFRRFFRARF